MATKCKVNVVVDEAAKGQAKDTIVFIHGWPDDHSLWDKQVIYFTDEGFRCVRLIIPNYDGNIQSRWGFDFPTVVSAMTEAIQANQVDNKPVILFTHDWGATYGYLLEKKHPELFSKMIALDIGMRARPSAKEKLYIVSYQFFLITCWWLCAIPVVGDPVASWLTRTLASFFGAPNVTSEKTSALINYPYYYLYRSGLAPIKEYSRHTPQCPMLFIYGERKPFFFHSLKWVNDVKSRPGCDALGLPTAHWIQHQKPDLVNKAVKKWLETGKCL